MLETATTLKYVVLWSGTRILKSQHREWFDINDIGKLSKYSGRTSSMRTLSYSSTWETRKFLLRTGFDG
jgi:hypothetical protein